MKDFKPTHALVKAYMDNDNKLYAKGTLLCYDGYLPNWLIGFWLLPTKKYISLTYKEVNKYVGTLEEVADTIESKEAKTDAKKMILPTDAKERKNIPITTGVLDYFPLAIAEVAKLSKAGNDQHNPGEDLHWDRNKSKDHADCISRHLIDRGKFDTDKMRHSAKLAWRALALLQLELENEQQKGK